MNNVNQFQILNNNFLGILYSNNSLIHLQIYQCYVNVKDICRLSLFS